MLNFEQALSLAEPYHCRVQKSIGGEWPSLAEDMLEYCKIHGNCETWPQIDGVKKICLDNLHTAIKLDSCLIYSFGLADDWTFEELMANLGCKVTQVLLNKKSKQISYIIKSLHKLTL